MKNINIKIEDDRHSDLVYITSYYSKITGVRLSQAQALQRLLFETANKFRKEEKSDKE
uniref:Uncharacterized protein n=1 Tax=uncultured prokaryote TaxID=198431 RepID=A0A0H5PWQ1_9ZZZZ|nr:hypothetical protein [uncultured prokaryote]